MNILVTGSAGFIGYHVSKTLIEQGYSVVGIDNLNNYYEVSLKKARLALLSEDAGDVNPSFKNYTFDLTDKSALFSCFEENKIDHVIHLAAQAGVRYSIENPQAYVQSNLIAFTNVLEACRSFNVKHLIYASTSSVYGASTESPFKEAHSADQPIQFYAATKRANELMAHSYSHLFSMPTTGLRFFTVYGPWGRPDMALFKFTKGIIENKPIQLFNMGNHTRDFTYVSDVAQSIVALLSSYPVSSSVNDTTNNTTPYRILNVGNSSPVQLTRYVEIIEECLGKKAIIEKLDMQPGDIQDTNSDTTLLNGIIGKRPNTKVEDGVKNFVEWYLKYYRIKF
ncbi:NAD-dependent epimerase/dehydratase family protein [Paracoccaceae bacterium]|nr:NAD-dependent epimerase/dehydratase family protein [Paracoccaceae bacterium]